MDIRHEVEYVTPQADLAEKRLLSAILHDNNCAHEAMGVIASQDFYLDTRQRLYGFFCGLIERGKPFDAQSVIEALQKASKLVSVGGLSAIFEITESLGMANSVQAYCQEILQASRHRKLIHVLNDSLANAMQETSDPDEVIADIQNATIEMTAKGEQETVSDVAQAVMTQILEIKAGNRIPGGIPTSLSGLDEITAGIKPGEYIVIAGRTGQGKSSLARQIALNASKIGHKPMFCTIEMTKFNLMQCMAATESRVPFDLIQDSRYMSQQQLEEVAQAIRRIQALPLEMADTSGLDIGELCARIRARIMRGVDLVFVDYLQLVRVRGANTDYERVTKSSAALRELANITKVPIVAISQLSRPKDEKEPPPTIYGLKESGNIENDAFQVWMIYRPREGNGDGRWHYTGLDQIIVGKNRNGPCDTIPVVYEGPFLNFKMRETR
jgi:replicative DNA helicase